jgi:hypothetical protein
MIPKLSITICALLDFVAGVLVGVVFDEIVGEGEGLGEMVGAGVDDVVGVGVAEGEAVGVGVDVGVGEEVGVGIGVGDGVGEGEGVGVGTGPTFVIVMVVTPASPVPWKSRPSGPTMKSRVVPDPGRAEPLMY